MPGQCPFKFVCESEIRGGLVVSALDSRSSGPGLSSDLGHCVVFLGKTHNSHCLSPSRSINEYQQTVWATCQKCWGGYSVPVMD